MPSSGRAENENIKMLPLCHIFNFSSITIGHVSEVNIPLASIVTGSKKSIFRYVKDDVVITNNIKL